MKNLKKSSRIFIALLGDQRQWDILGMGDFLPR
jgi:hypothetical protein